MNSNKNILNCLLNNVIDYTTDLLELGYSLKESIKYGLGFIYNQKERRDLSTVDYIELENNYMQKVIAFC